MLMPVLRFRGNSSHAHAYTQGTDDEPPPTLLDRSTHWSHFWLVMDPPEQRETSLLPYAGGDDSERPKALEHRR